MFDLTDVGFVKRVKVGSMHHEALQHDDVLQEGMDLLNRCLTDFPKGTIIGMEKSFTLMNVGEFPVVLQWVCYHIGFPRKPNWLEEPRPSATSHAHSPTHHPAMPPT